jgi:hypothetical protein
MDDEHPLIFGMVTDNSHWFVTLKFWKCTVWKGSITYAAQALGLPYQT